MNESPGWASPGSSPSEPPRDRAPKHDDEREQSPEQSAPEGAPAAWSARQPPGAEASPQGSAPAWGAPPSAGPPTGWGGGGGAWQHARAAKPGVIPLRPLGVTEILDGAVSTMRAHWRPVLGIALGIAVVIQLISTVVTGVWFRDLTDLTSIQNDPNPSMSEVMDALNGTMVSESIAMLATMIGTVIVTAMLTMVVSRAVLGRSVSVAEAWNDARPLLLRLLGLTLLITVIVLGALLVCTLPGLLLASLGSPAAGAGLALLGILGGVLLAVWLWVKLCLAAPALMLERQGAVRALRRSAKLVRGAWWRVFGVQILTLLLVTVIGFVVSLPTTAVATLFTGDGGEGFLTGQTTLTWPYLIIVGIGSVLVSTVTLPFSAGVGALLYIDRRIRREGLDIELTRAAEGPAGGPGGGDDGAPRR